MNVLSRETEHFLMQLAALAGGEMQVVHEAVAAVNRASRTPTMDGPGA